MLDAVVAVDRFHMQAAEIWHCMLQGNATNNRGPAEGTSGSETSG